LKERRNCAACTKLGLSDCPVPRSAKLRDRHGGKQENFHRDLGKEKASGRRGPGGGWGGKAAVGGSPYTQLEHSRPVDESRGLNTHELEKGAA